MPRSSARKPETGGTFPKNPKIWSHNPQAHDGPMNMNTSAPMSMSATGAPSPGDTAPAAPAPSAPQDQSSGGLLNVFNIMMKASVSTTKETPEADADGDGDANMDSTPTPAQEVDESPAEPEESTLDVAAIHRKRKRRSKSGSGDAGAGGSSRKKGTGTTYCVNKNSELRLKEMNLEKQGFAVKDGNLDCVACNVFSGTKKSSIMQHLRSDKHIRKHIRSLAARPAQYKRDEASRVVLSDFMGPASNGLRYHSPTGIPSHTAHRIKSRSKQGKQDSQCKLAQSLKTHVSPHIKSLTQQT